ncbi:unnamed protein product [Schistosoma mattheei]|uniref:Uncharacterized protein n=1 Tax=Schistosoma mattheei TaxID=31246 RepID=A0A183Q5N1_9TREM|nr:unnamed protein product [Schistosoma mattheei]
MVSESKQPSLIVPRIQVQNIVEQVHRELEHSGKQKTIHAIYQRFWWPCTHEDIAEFCKPFGMCYVINYPQQIPRSPLFPVTTEDPHQRARIDIMEPLTTSKNGNRCILAVVEYFSKWCEATPIPQQDALKTARGYTDHWVSRYGAPASLHPKVQLLKAISSPGFADY